MWVCFHPMTIVGITEGDGAAQSITSLGERFRGTHTFRFPLSVLLHPKERINQYS